MANGAVSPTPPPNGGGGAGIWAWLRPAGIGLLLAVVLLVLLAGLLNDLLPGTGGGVVTGPTPSPAPSISVLPTTTATPVPTATGGGTGDDGTGTGGDGTNPGGGGNNNGGGSNNNGGGSNNNGGGKTDPPVPLPTRTGVPTPTGQPPSPYPTPTASPNLCTVYDPPGYCRTRQLLQVSIRPGNLTLTNTLGSPQLGNTAALVGLRPGSSVSGPSVSGRIAPIMLSDDRGGVDGWTVKANVAWPGGIPDGIVVTVDPTCAMGHLNAAPGFQAGRAGQSLSQPVTMCTKDGQVGTGGSTSGVYMIGGQVSVSSWIGTPIPATGVLVTFSVS